MSHIVTIKTEVRDLAAIRGACRRLNLDQPERGTFQLFRRSATGVAVRLQNWNYPIVCDVATGQVHYDNYEGRWGDQRELDGFFQAYAVEKAKLEARRKGHTVSEQPLNDGSIKLTIEVQGVAA